MSTPIVNTDKNVQTVSSTSTATTVQTITNQNYFFFKQLEGVTHDNISFSNSSLLFNFDSQNYSTIWKNFLNIIQEHFNKQIKSIINDHNKELRELKEKYTTTQKELFEKINNLNTKLEGDEKYISELEFTINNLQNKKLSSLGNSNTHSQEKNIYAQKELLRDYKSIVSENTQIKLDYNHISKNMNHYINELNKLKNLLVILSQNGVPIDDIYFNSKNNNYSVSNILNEANIKNIANDNIVSITSPKSISTNPYDKNRDKYDADGDKSPYIKDIKGNINLIN